MNLIHMGFHSVHGVCEVTVGLFKITYAGNFEIEFRNVELPVPTSVISGM